MQVLGTLNYNPRNGFVFLDVPVEVATTVCLPSITGLGFELRYPIRIGAFPGAHMSLMLSNEYGMVTKSWLDRLQGMKFKLEVVRI